MLVCVEAVLNAQLAEMKVILIEGTIEEALDRTHMTLLAFCALMYMHHSLWLKWDLYFLGCLDLFGFS
jgi:hypothetical protein